MSNKNELSFLKKMKLPKMYKIRQNFDSPVIDNVNMEVKKELESQNIKERLTEGQKVAIGVGSRGIANLSIIVKTVVEVLKGWKVKPFIVPAMGTHGGANPDGQKKVLADYNITEESMGVPVKASTDVLKVGSISQGIPVYFNKLVIEDADAYIPINRVKLHTDFCAENESGIMKMLAIGFGNPKQASILHSKGINGLKCIPEVAEEMIANTNFAFGVGIVENAYDQTAKIKAILPENLRSQEADLLKLSKKLFPSFPVSKFDLLIVDEIGKNVSGSGMDTNILGRISIKGEKDPEEPDIFRVIALDVTSESHGNAIGVGLADYTTARLFKKINFKDLRENAVTSSFVERGKIPLPIPSDKLCIKAALHSCWHVETNTSKIIRIKNTLEMSEMYVSENIFKTIKDKDNIEVLSEGQEFMFNEEDNLF